MRRTIRKWFWVWNFDKEEQWLNEMAAKGLCLVSVGFCKYEFEDCINTRNRKPSPKRHNKRRNY